MSEPKANSDALRSEPATVSTAKKPTPVVQPALRAPWWKRFGLTPSAAVAGLSALFSLGAWQAASRQADLTAASVALTKEAFNNSNRPNVLVDTFETIDPGNNADFRFHFAVKNFGALADVFYYRGYTHLIHEGTDVTTGARILEQTPRPLASGQSTYITFPVLTLNVAQRDSIRKGGDQLDLDLIVVSKGGSMETAIALDFRFHYDPPSNTLIFRSTRSSPER